MKLTDPGCPLLRKQETGAAGAGRTRVDRDSVLAGRVAFAAIEDRTSFARTIPVAQFARIRANLNSGEFISQNGL
jgi:hypothetical protein